MDNWIIFILGAMIGIGLGSYFTAIAKPQKQWSKLTKGEKKIRIWFLSTAIILLISGVVVLFLFKE
ncbi:MAG: hypothetical protein P8Z35_05470 [Ignavibacteriaceae bacterium]